MALDKIIKYNKGVKRAFTIVELVVVAAIFGTAVVAFFGAATISFKAIAKASDKVQAAFLMEEGLEGVRYLRDLSWTRFINQEPLRGEECFTFNGTTNDGIVMTNLFATSSMPCTPIDNKFKRTITFFDVCEDTTTNAITGVAPSCAIGSAPDYGRKKVTVKVSWEASNYSYSESADMYIANLFNSN